MHLARWAYIGLALGFLVGALGCNSSTHGTVVDADGDGVPADQDCNDHDSQVWRTAQLYPDADGDGHGSVFSASTMCIGSTLPAGYAEVGDDCDDFDAAVWSGRRAYVDDDRDGRGRGDPVLICGGAQLPAGYAEVGGDCDDTDASHWQLVSLYLDFDRDGVGSGELVSVCAGDTVPVGYSAKSGDCGPYDGTLWQELPYLYRDADGDGYTVAKEGVVCSGDVLPAGYATEPRGNDCDDTAGYLHESATAYVDSDGDSHGSGSTVTVCTSGDAYLPWGYSRDDSDCAPDDPYRWQMLSYFYVDRDGDSRVDVDPGSICSGATLPTKYYDIYSSPGGIDCNDADPSVWRSWTGYVDADGDGVGAGPAQEFCIGAGPPQGYSTQGDDCAPDDAMRWRSYAYSYRDADGDGYGVAESGTICFGTSLPAGYGVSVGKGFDCDDSNPLTFRAITAYPDTDGDGVGAGQSTTFCADGAGAIPAGYSLQGTDCAPDDPTRWATVKYAYVDRDGDGYTAPEAGQVCTGATLPDPYRAKASGNDCNDGDPALYQWVVLYQDKDGDGIGAPPRTVQCLADALPTGWSIFGWDEDDSNKAVHWTGDEEDELLIAQP